MAHLCQRAQLQYIHHQIFIDVPAVFKDKVLCCIHEFTISVLINTTLLSKTSILWISYVQFRQRAQG